MAAGPGPNPLPILAGLVLVPVLACVVIVLADAGVNTRLIVSFFVVFAILFVLAVALSFGAQRIWGPRDGVR